MQKSGHGIYAFSKCSFEKDDKGSGGRELVHLWPPSSPALQWHLPFLFSMSTLHPGQQMRHPEGRLTIKKNSFESVLMRWMKLEPIIQSEVSPKDKDQYSILTHIYGI